MKRFSELTVPELHQKIEELNDTVLAMLSVLFNRPKYTLRTIPDEELDALQAISNSLGEKPSESVRGVLDMHRSNSDILVQALENICRIVPASEGKAIAKIQEIATKALKDFCLANDQQAKRLGDLEIGKRK